MEKWKSNLIGFGVNDDSSSGRLLQLQYKNYEPPRSHIPLQYQTTFVAGSSMRETV